VPASAGAGPVRRGTDSRPVAVRAGTAPLDAQAAGQSATAGVATNGDGRVPATVDAGRPGTGGDTDSDGHPEPEWRDELRRRAGVVESAGAVSGPALPDGPGAEPDSGPGDALTSSAATATLGQPVTITVGIRSSVPNAPPTGTVTFRDGERVLGAVPLDESGEARITVADLTAGEHDIRADYSGDANFAPSSAALRQSVGRATTRTTIVLSAASAAPGGLGAAVTLDATVSADTLGTATGSVTFRDGTAVLGTAPLDPEGRARLSTEVGWGSHAVSAIYSGDDVFGPSLGNLTQIIQANTATTLWITPPRSAFGESVTLTATVRSAASGPVTGDVTFSDGDRTLGIVALEAGGEAQLSTPALAAGDHVLRADYSGTAHLAASSAEARHQVDKATTSAVLSASVPPEAPLPPAP
jgi:hypothetical protein